MIGYLKGRIAERLSSGETSVELIVDVGGVGYRVQVSPHLEQATGRSSAIELFVHTHVRESAITLYGFPSASELSCFELLLSAHGVGPSLALAAVSTHSPERLSEIIAAGDAAALSLVPGIGKKTASRLILELRSRLGDLELGATSGLSGRDGSQAPSLTSELTEALLQLGYPSDEVRAVLRELPPTGEIEELLRQALRELAPRH